MSLDHSKYDQATLAKDVKVIEANKQLSAETESKRTFNNLAPNYGLNSITL